ncbi:uroporphyrinogen-III C-methyltransferase [Tropicibacter oceani]|uniref:uroporphyrinogen-III C-methyltransferase n=1 Tax=Tropicibacter oceani TaxID=3058420 RepID=A0ABY8QLY3_9RHOB|nr:uroporphyrinogen-III C-methyltransferase [Tropicibacter oceani]WGW05644.1 uroporphyrinogen-III C-methyltransferase [Tropicibacter oceani]
MSDLSALPAPSGLLSNVLRFVWGAARSTRQPAAPARDRADQRQGHIALVGAGPGARDLLTLRAVKRLQEADMVFHDRLVDPEVLGFARPGAELVFVGKEVGAHAWPQERINQVIVAEAARGRRVVRLKSGDPGVFGRAGEEIAAANARAIPVEIIPGVTAVCAAAASMGQSLTERGVADTLVLATGMGQKGDPLPDCTRLSGPGTTTGFYMSVRQAQRISDALMARGLPGDAPVCVAVEVSKPGERSLRGTVSGLAQLIRDNDVRGCAILLVTWPREAGATVTRAAPVAADLPA